MTCGGYSRPMTDPTRGARARRGGRRPGWLLMTVLLVLAIGASSALVFTNRVELLKLAVILALWAAVVAAFVSVIYRRQSDTDQAKVRDLKLVYDLQLDREISARREYELSVETQLRRELASELRAQAADEVPALRAELAALRANLENLFDADLSHRPAIETDRNRVRGLRRLGPARRDRGPGHQQPHRHRGPRRGDDLRTEESPIIDVPAEPHPPEDRVGRRRRAAGGAHRRPSEAERRTTGDVRARCRRAWQPPPPPPTASAAAATPHRRSPQPQFALAATATGATPSRRNRHLHRRRCPQAPSTDWQPAPAEGQWIPAGAPGSNWVSPASARTDQRDEYVGRRSGALRAPPPAEPATPPQPVEQARRPVDRRNRARLRRRARRPAEPVRAGDVDRRDRDRRGRHSAPPEAADPDARRRRPGRGPPQPLGRRAAGTCRRLRQSPSTRHRREDEPAAAGRSRGGAAPGGSRSPSCWRGCRPTPTGGGRRRRRED